MIRKKKTKKKGKKKASRTPRKKAKKKVIKKKTKKKSIFKTDVFHSVSWDDFGDFIKEVYKVESYDFVSSEECGNDSSHTFMPTGKMNDYYNGQMRQFIANDGAMSYVNHYIFEDLVAKKKISPGNYIVNVCW